MEFRFQRFDDRQPNQVFHTHSSSSSYSSYNIFSYQQPMDIPVSIHRELEKERIRSEIIAGEIHRQRVLEADVRREMLIERGGFPWMAGQRYSPEVMHENFYAPEQRCGGGGVYGGFEAVPVLRLPESPKLKEIVDYQPSKIGKNEMIGLGNPFVSSGSKRKQSPSLAGSGSTGHCSNSSKKKIREEFSCAVCEITATCERGLNEHIAGKKHRTKMEELIKANKKSPNIGLGNSNNSVSIGSNDDNKTEGCNKKITAGHKFRFWCRLCKIGVDDENVMRSHRKGKKHLKNGLKKKREKTRRTLSKK